MTTQITTLAAQVQSFREKLNKVNKKQVKTTDNILTEQEEQVFNPKRFTSLVSYRYQVEKWAKGNRNRTLQKNLVFAELNENDDWQNYLAEGKFEFQKSFNCLRVNWEIEVLILSTPALIRNAVFNDSPTIATYVKYLGKEAAAQVIGNIIEDVSNSISVNRYSVNRKAVNRAKDIISKYPFLNLIETKYFAKRHFLEYTCYDKCRTYFLSEFQKRKSTNFKNIYA